jgi:nucleoside-diphosphate-sugar epimerase
VDDVVRALLLAGATERCLGSVWNLGSKSRHSLLDLVKLLRESCAVEYEIVPFPDDKGIIDIGDYYGDYSAFAEATSWQPEVELGEGLERTLAAYRQHPEQYWA